ncbi:hypothetical protein H6G06_25440 [Anabaena sphaerica FACHB-251]|uniref:Uncharacterized protein n=1 Tax=Anabaena sphaerica FACHB-251 TaxID=2692883 RepID=A0A927A4N4_9NOST|nr:hypothetical protein [Anabaena sphaerica]MBD2296735.1 hypothetical protein [Anabaena sphaerica FACHB-251]
MLNQDYALNNLSTDFQDTIDKYTVLQSSSLQLGEFTKNILELDNIQDDSFSSKEYTFLYEIVFYIWQFQHQSMIDSVKDRNYRKDVLQEHLNVLTVVINNHLFHESEPCSSRKQDCLKAWDDSLELLQKYSSYGNCNNSTVEKYLAKNTLLDKTSSELGVFLERINGFLDKYFNILVIPFGIISLIIYAVFFDK